jgi:hypothetical protein
VRRAGAAAAVARAPHQTARPGGAPAIPPGTCRHSPWRCRCPAPAPPPSVAPPRPPALQTGCQTGRPGCGSAAGRARPAPAACAGTGQRQRPQPQPQPRRRRGQRQRGLPGLPPPLLRQLLSPPLRPPSLPPPGAPAGRGPAPGPAGCAAVLTSAPAAAAGRLRPHHGDRCAG